MAAPRAPATGAAMIPATLPATAPAKAAAMTAAMAPAPAAATAPAMALAMVAVGAPARAAAREADAFYASFNPTAIWRFSPAHFTEPQSTFPRS